MAIKNTIKELHVWLIDDYPSDILVIHSLNSALVLLNNNAPIVHTTQTHCFATEWIEKGYHIFAHLLDGNVVEIKFGKNIFNIIQNVFIRI